MKLLFENWRQYLKEQGVLRLNIAGTPLRVEIASDEEDISKGLMHRDELDANSGMLFMFPDSAERSFWMKNTNIPLSIAYIDDAGEILNIEDMEPHDLSGIPSRGPARCAIETNRGWFKDNGIRPGDAVEGIPL